MGLILFDDTFIPMMIQSKLSMIWHDAIPDGRSCNG